MQDFRHPGVRPDEQPTGDHQGELSRTHNAPLVELGIGLGGAQASFGLLEIFDDLGEHLLHMRDLA